MNYIFLLLLLEILLFAFAFWGTKKDIMAPSVIVCIVFLAGTVVTILNLGKWDKVQYGLLSCLIVSAGILVFVLAEQAVCSIHMKDGRLVIAEGVTCENKSQPFCAFEIQTWKLIALLALSVGVVVADYIGIRNIVIEAGMDTDSVISTYRKIMVSASQISFNNIPRAGGLVLSQLAKVVDAAGYICLYCFINNHLAGKGKNVKNCFLLAIAVISLLPHLLIGGRSEVLHMAVAAIIIYYILWHQREGWDKSLVKQYIIVGIVFVAISIPLFYLLLVLTGRSSGLETNPFDHASEYVGAGVALFDQYVKLPTGAPAYFGEESLIGIVSTLARLGLITEPVSGRVPEMRALSSDGIYRSNVYTSFRRPYHDFGFVGMLIFLAVIAIFFAWFYNKKIKNRPRTRATDYWVLVYGYLYYWLFFAAIEQKSIEFLSVSIVLVIIAMLIGFFLVVHVKVSFRDKKITIV